MEKVQMIAMGTWAERKALHYVPVNSEIEGKRFGAYGLSLTSNWDVAAVRRPFRMEEGESAYIMYDDDSAGPVPIYRIQEV